MFVHLEGRLLRAGRTEDGSVLGEIRHENKILRFYALAGPAAEEVLACRALVCPVDVIVDGVMFLDVDLTADVPGSNMSFRVDACEPAKLAFGDESSLDLTDDAYLHLSEAEAALEDGDVDLARIHLAVARAVDIRTTRNSTLDQSYRAE